MEWNDKLQNIIDYVENHLQKKEEPVDPQEIAEMAGCSFDFFQKVFSYMNSMSFSEYIRYRKLTLAGYDVKSTQMKIVDLAYKYGYDSPTSFTKAFQLFHGTSPKVARSKEVELTVIPKMQVLYKQRYAWRIESKPELKLIGLSKKISCVQNEHYRQIPNFWNECRNSDAFNELISLDTSGTKGMLGFTRNTGSKDEIDYSIMVISNKETPVDFSELVVPATTWAIFDCKGAVPESIQKGWKYLNEEWVIKYPFKHAECPDIEWYSDGNPMNHDYLSQIWIPILEEE